jgi:hypothetical protein
MPTRFSEWSIGEMPRRIRDVLAYHTKPKNDGLRGHLGLLDRSANRTEPVLKSARPEFLPANAG